MSEENEWDDLPEPSEEFKDLWPGLKDQNVEELIELYREHRDELAVLRKAYKQKEANVKDLLSRIGMALRDKAESMGVTSFATPAGTAYRSTKVKYRIGDWPTFIDFVKRNELWHMLEKRVGKLAAVEVHEERKLQAAQMPEDFDPTPPGLIHIEEVVMDVRKPTSKRK